jgi:myo-inositol-1-phosphate synthase
MPGSCVAPPVMTAPDGRKYKALFAPLVIDLARLALFAQSKKESGVLRHLACFFKSPMGVAEQSFFRQAAMLQEYLLKHT